MIGGIPRGNFALSGGRFPMNTMNRTRLAIPMAEKSFHAGNISAPQEHAVMAKAHAKLGGIGMNRGALLGRLR